MHMDKSASISILPALLRGSPAEHMASATRQACMLPCAALLFLLVVFPPSLVSYGGVSVAIVLAFFCAFCVQLFAILDCWFVLVAHVQTEDRRKNLNRISCMQLCLIVVSMVLVW